MPADPTPLAFAIPSVHVNLSTITYINGVFRITFLEQNLTYMENGEVRELLAPRASIIMAPDTCREFVEALGAFYTSVVNAGRGMTQQ